MEPGRTCNGMPDKSLLFRSLKVYLNNKNRLQPIIGLGSITECVKAGSHDQQIFYLCKVCQSRLNRTDVRNHIMGGIHRYNYIRDRHPHLVAEWGNEVDLSDLARLLMDMASVLEKEEGPGEVQVLQLNAFDFQEMELQSEASVISQLNAVRCEQVQRMADNQPEYASPHVESCTVRSQRIVLPQKTFVVLKQNDIVERQTFNVQVPQINVLADKSVSVIETSSVYMEGRLEAADSLQTEHIHKSVECRFESENGDDFFDVCTGIALIGLDCVLEYRRKDDGQASCFLCHCCRTKSSKDDIIDHMTSSSHISNYLMEVHPECLDDSEVGVDADWDLLQSAAWRVKQKEGRGEPKVIELPANLCNLLTDKTYHWCIKMLSGGGSRMSAKPLKKTIHFKGSSVGVLEASNSVTTHKGIEVTSEQAGARQSQTSAKKRKNLNEANPVFKVSLPLSKGDMLLKRTSFSLDGNPKLRTASPITGPSFSTSPEPPLAEMRSGHGPSSVATFEQQNPTRVFREDGHIQVQYLGNEGHVDKLSVSRDWQLLIKVEKNQNCASLLHGDMYAREVTGTTSGWKERSRVELCHPQGEGITRVLHDWNNAGQPHGQEEFLMADWPRDQDWSVHDSNKIYPDGKQPHDYFVENKVGLGVGHPGEEGQSEWRSYTCDQQCYPQQTQQNLSQANYAVHPAENTGHPRSYWDMAPSLDVNKNSLGPVVNNGNNIGGEHGYGTQPIGNAYYNQGLQTYPHPLLPPPCSDAAWTDNQSHMFTLPRQAPGYGPHPYYASRGDHNTFPIDLMPEVTHGAPASFMVPHPSQGLPSADLTAPHWAQYSAQRNVNPASAIFDQREPKYTPVGQHFI